MEHIAHGNYILVEDIDNEQVTDGGIVLATGVKTQDISKRSKIVSISEKLERQFEDMGHKFPLKNGDIIYRRYYSGNEIKARDNKTMYALHIDDVLSKEFTG